MILVVFSFNETRSATVWSGFNLDWYAKAFDNDDIQRSLDAECPEKAIKPVDRVWTKLEQ